MALELRPIAAAEEGALTLGESNINRLYTINNNITIPNQVLRLGYLTAKKTETITAVRMGSAGTPAGATPSLVRYGVYEVAANGDLTLIASTPNDTTIFSVANTAYQKTLSVPFLKVAGVRYAAGALVVTAFAAPSIASNSIMAADLASAPKLNAAMAAQADLAGSYTNAQAVTGTALPYVALVP